jgi:hypothetical protein
MGQFLVALVNVMLGHAVLMWIVPLKRGRRLDRFWVGCARSAAIAVVMALALAIERKVENPTLTALFCLAVVAFGSVAGGLVSAVWRPD